MNARLQIDLLILGSRRLGGSIPETGIAGPEGVGVEDGDEPST